MTQSIESMIEVLQAYKDRKKIEYRIVGSTQWSATDDPQWQFRGCEYRIAQEPKKKVKLEAWLTPTGALVWYDISKVNAWSTYCIRVPSEDKEVEL